MTGAERLERLEWLQTRAAEHRDRAAKRLEELAQDFGDRLEPLERAALAIGEAYLAASFELAAANMGATADLEERAAARAEQAAQLEAFQRALEAPLPFPFPGPERGSDA